MVCLMSFVSSAAISNAGLCRGCDRIRAIICRSRSCSARKSPPYLLSIASALHNDSVRRIWLPTEHDTYRLGHILGSDARPSDALMLDGQLGAGKTCVARGYIHSARNDSSLQVTSPTYLLANTYPPQNSPEDRTPTVYHLDLWRLDDASSRPIVDFGFVFRSAVALIEWPDRLKSLLPEERLDIILEYPQNDSPSENGDDPWGFGTGEPDDLASSRSGRYARLVPHGVLWRTRIDSLYRHHVRQEVLEHHVDTLQP